MQIVPIDVLKNIQSDSNQMQLYTRRKNIPVKHFDKQIKYWE